MIWTWRYNKQLNTADERADKLITRAVKDGNGEWHGAGEPAVCTRSLLQRLMERGRVTMDAAPIHPDSKLRDGAAIKIEFLPPESIDLKPEAVDIEVLFEDHDIAVINKPQGFAVHPSLTKKHGTLVNILLHRLGKLSSIGGPLRPGIVHRLDKDTSGVLVVSKTDIANMELVKTCSTQSIERV